MNAKRVFALVLVLMMVLALTPERAAKAEGNVFSIKGLYSSRNGDGFGTFTVGETCPVCHKGTLQGEFGQAQGSLDAYHAIACRRPDCAAHIEEDCKGDATCTQSATCTVCGNTYRKGHRYVYIYAKDATCTEIGYRTACYYCQDCQLYYDRYDNPLPDVVIPAGHDWGLDDTKGDGGWEWAGNGSSATAHLKCQREGCGETADVTDSSPQKESHQIEWTFTATVTKDGKTFTGTYSRTRITVTITARDQTYVYTGETQGEGDTTYQDQAQIAKKVIVKGLQDGDAVANVTIDGQGLDVGTYSLIPSNAKISKATDNYDYEITYVNGTLTIRNPYVTFRNENGTGLEGKEVTYGETPAYSGETPTKAPTAEGHYTFDGWMPALTAATEDAIYTATYRLESHSEAIDPALPATCTDTGLTEGKHCSVCSKVLVKQETVPAKGHTEVVDKAVEPTCTETGLTEGKHCSVCNEVLVKQEEIPANGHTEVVDKAVEPTCTETGLTEGKHCSVCGEVLVAQETVPAKGHTEVVDAGKDATCTETGLTEGKHCSVCNEVLVKQEEIPANGHTEVVDKAVEPTCTETGLTEGKHCSVCGEILTKQETVAALGHDYKETSRTILRVYLRCERCEKRIWRDNHRDKDRMEGLLVNEAGEPLSYESTVTRPEGKLVLTLTPVEAEKADCLALSAEALEEWQKQGLDRVEFVYGEVKLVIETEKVREWFADLEEVDAYLFTLAPAEGGLSVTVEALAGDVRTAAQVLTGLTLEKGEQTLEIPENGVYAFEE